LYPHHILGDFLGWLELCGLVGGCVVNMYVIFIKMLSAR
jgi:hypothetical protein